MKDLGGMYIKLNHIIMVMTHPSLSPQPGIWGNLLGLRGRVVRICVRVVNLTLVSFTHLILVWMYVYSSTYENGCMCGLSITKAR